MKRKLIHNLGLKLVSVVLAIMFWFVVMNISDYVMTVRIYDIPVEEINGEVLSGLDKVYDIVSGDTVDIIVKGRRSVVSKLEASDFVATADLSKMSITNTAQIFVKAKNGSVNDDITISCVDNTLKLNLEEKVVTDFPVKVVTTGEVAKGYAVGELEVKPNLIAIEGPSSAVNKITEVRATVDVSNLRDDSEAKAKIRLYDAYGEEINNDKLKLARERVNVSVKVYPVKEVKVNVNIVGNPSEGYSVSRVAYQPQTVKIAGDEERLSQITEININGISVVGLKEDLETTVALADYLPSDVFVADTPEIAVSVGIQKLVTKTFIIKPEYISVEGKNTMYSYDVSVSDNCKVEVSGLDDSVSKLQIADIAPRINVTDMTVGVNNNVTVEFKEIEGVTYKKEGTVNVTIKEK